MFIKERIKGLDWQVIEQALWERGYAKTPPVLTPDECAGLTARYADEAKFRSRIDMARYRFGPAGWRRSTKPTAGNDIFG